MGAGKAIFTVSVLLTVLAFVCAFVSGSPAPQLPAEEGEQDAFPQYQYNYAINDPISRDTKSHSEFRYGDTVRGSYSVMDPDGTFRQVDYVADDANGFQATVSKTPLAAAGAP